MSCMGVAMLEWESDEVELTIWIYSKGKDRVMILKGKGLCFIWYLLLPLWLNMFPFSTFCVLYSEIPKWWYWEMGPLACCLGCEGRDLEDVISGPVNDCSESYAAFYPVKENMQKTAASQKRVFPRTWSRASCPQLQTSKLQPQHREKSMAFVHTLHHLSPCCSYSREKGFFLLSPRYWVRTV